MNDKQKMTRQISIRVDDAQYQRLLTVADQIAEVSRGQKPEVTEILRSIIGWGNRGLLTDIERAFIAGDIDALHGEFPAVPKAASGSGKLKAAKG